MIEPTDEMKQAFVAAAGWPPAPWTLGPDVVNGLAAVLAIVERDYEIEPRGISPERGQLCGAVYVDPRGGDRPPQDPCGKTRGHENGPETDWKRGYHSNGMLKWLVEP